MSSSDALAIRVIAQKTCSYQPTNQRSRNEQPHLTEGRSTCEQCRGRSKRAGLTDVPSSGIPTGELASREKPIATPASDWTAHLSVTIRIAKTNSAGQHNFEEERATHPRCSSAAVRSETTGCANHAERAHHELQGRSTEDCSQNLGHHVCEPKPDFYLLVAIIAIVTAGLIWQPEIPPIAYTRNIKTNPNAIATPRTPESER